jgi:hypothetical protein
MMHINLDYSIPMQDLSSSIETFVDHLKVLVQVFYEIFGSGPAASA